MASPTSPAHSTTLPRITSSTNLNAPPSTTTTLARLVAHFVAAKRALTTTTYVYRANEIVSAARQCLDDIDAATPQNTFLRGAISKQLTVLKSIRSGLEVAAEDGYADFQAMLKRLDAADSEVQRTLQALRGAEIEPTFRPKDEKSRSLHSFVDERGVAELKADFRECIDLTTEAHGDFRDLNVEFDSAIREIEQGLQPKTSERPDLVNSVIDEAESGPDSLFRNLEEHASETAELLQSLVKHFDLCTTALKHTEGGGEAVHAAYSRANKDTGEVDEAFQDDVAKAPMSAEERAEMLAVLDGDAQEVDHAVREIRDRAAEMEGYFSRLQSQATLSKEAHDQAASTVSALEQLSDSGQLDKYVGASKVYAERWAEIKTRIEAGLDEFAGFATFFKGFQTAYQYLLLEIDRRRKTRLAMERVITDTQKVITDLYEEEDERRNKFRAEYGDFLPADMWPPLVDPPTKWILERKDDGTADIPSVREDSLRQAIHQLRPRRQSKG